MLAASTASAPPMLTPSVDRFSAMYASALPVVYGFVALRVGGNRSLAEDLTSEAFAAAVAEYRAGRPDIVTTSWLCTVAKRRLIDHWRRKTSPRTTSSRSPAAASSSTRQRPVNATL